MECRAAFARCTHDCLFSGDVLNREFLVEIHSTSANGDLKLSSE
jgi:hypothetical protein